MARVVVLAVALAFIVGFAILTVTGIRDAGFGVESIVSLVVLALLVVGIVGALRNPPGR
jgi:quinol-cytochrome oxidoreductase complex cytochrome b subunit